MQSDVGQLPVRGNDAVEILINDHEQIRGMLTRFTDATDAEERESILEQLKGALTIHNATEENLVYPALAKVAGKKAEAQKLYHETAEADMLVFEIDSLLKEGDEETVEEKADRLQAAILEHMDDEEQKAFPHLQQNADPDEAAMLTESVRDFRGAIRFSPSGGRGSRTETGEIGTPRSSRKTRP